LRFARCLSPTTRRSRNEPTTDNARHSAQLVLLWRGEKVGSVKVADEPAIAVAGEDERPPARHVWCFFADVEGDHSQVAGNVDLHVFRHEVEPRCRGLCARYKVAKDPRDGVAAVDTIRLSQREKGGNVVREERGDRIGIESIQRVDETGHRRANRGFIG